MSKLFLFIGTFFLLSFLNLDLTKAVSSEGEVLINYRLINEQKAKVEIELNIINQSKEDLISEVGLSMFCKDLKLVSVSNGSNVTVNGRENIKINLFDNPINIGQRRYFNFSFFCSPDIQKDIGLRSLFIPRLLTDFKLRNYQLNIFYPVEWGSVLFLSSRDAINTAGKVVLNKNSNLFLQWEDDEIIGFDYDLSSVKFEEDSFLPVPRNHSSQVVNFTFFPSSFDVFKDTDNNFFLRSKRNEKEDNLNRTIKGRISFSRTPDVYIDEESLSPILQEDILKNMNIDVSGNREQDVENALKFFRNNFKFTNRHDLRKLEGDELDLSILFISWLRGNGIHARLNIGWYIGEEEQRYSLWVSWYDGEKWNNLSVSDYLKGNFDVLDKIPAYITLLTVTDFSRIEVEDIRRIFVNFIPLKLSKYYEDANQNFNGDDRIVVDVFWEDKYYFTEFGLKGNLFIRNNTDSFIYIGEVVANDFKVHFSDDMNIRDMTYLIAPGQEKNLEIVLSSFDFSLLRTNYIETQIKYGLFESPPVYTQNFSQSIERNNIVFPFKPFIITLFTIFLALLAIGRREKIKELL